MSDIGVGVDQNETTTSLPSSHNSDDSNTNGSVSRNASLMTLALTANGNR